jgi:hypothetical protein
MRKNIGLIILILGLISACGTQPTATPASQPTLEPVAPTQTFTSAPAATIIPTEISLQPTNTAEVQPAALVSFANDVLPLFESRCKNCHGGNKTEEGLNLLSYAAVMQGSDNGAVVIPGDADNSLLVEQLVTQEMPKRGPKWTPDQIQIVIDWINQGALDN